jgi:outer membrane immunogenic protein
MSRIWISISALAAVCSSASLAFAADMPVKAAPVVAAAYDWSGFYGGINGGGETQKHDWAFNPALPPPAVNQSWSERVDSATIGFHVGVQKQWTNSSSALKAA